MITRTFKLCLNAGTGSAPFINVSQTDKDEVWLFELYTETGERYIPSSGAIIGIKADGHGIANTGTVDSEGRVVITETEQMTAAAGRSIFELSIDGLTHGTANFIVNVEKKPIDGAIMSDSDLSLISQAVDSAAVIVDVIGDSDPSEVIGEHVDDWLDNHPEATTTVLDGAITAPKINNSLWDKLLVSEEASGNPASFDDGADDVPVSSLKVALEPIQLGSGDPSPSNVRPIIASNGKNLLQNVNSTRTQNGITYTVNADGSVTATGTATSASYFVFTSANNSINDYTVTIIPSGTSIIASTDSTKVLRVRYTDGTYENLTNGSAKTLTKNIGLVLVEYSSGTTANETIKPMIRLASITDSTYQPYQSIMVDVVGKNHLPSPTATTKTNNGITVSVDNGVYSISGIATGTAEIILDLPFDVTVTENDKCCYLNDSVNAGVVFYWRYNNTNGASMGMGSLNRVTNFSSSNTYNKVRFLVANGTVITRTMHISPVLMNKNNTDETFEPYTSASYPYTLGQNVYGGSVDLATGVLTVTHFLYEYDGTESFSKSGTALNGFYNQLTTSTPHNWPELRNYNDVSLLTNECSNMFMPTRNVNTYKNNYGYVYFDSGHNFNCDPDLFGTTVDSFMAKLAELYANGTPVSVFCQIAEPQTIQLTPTEVKTLLGYNNISSTGTVDVIYHADTKLYVDKMTAVDNNIIAPTEKTFTATRNYTVNDLVIVADTLYKVTANIASGGTITPNSNVTQTTLSALIKALS